MAEDCNIETVPDALGGLSCLSLLKIRNSYKVRLSDLMLARVEPFSSTCKPLGSLFLSSLI